MDIQKPVRIVSDGTSAGTKVYIDGVESHYVTKVEWSCEVDHVATARVTYAFVEVDVVGDGESS